MPFEPVILFFLLGLFAGVIRSDLKIPGVLYESISIFLLLAIGLKGGVELARYPFDEFIGPALWVVVIATLIPLAAFPILRRLGGLPRLFGEPPRALCLRAAGPAQGLVGRRRGR